MPYPLPLTRTEAYLAYKAGVIQQSDLKPSLAVPRNGIDAWLAYWTGLAADYPKREDGTPHILQEEEAYIAYLCGVINEYPEKCLRRVGAYLRYLISARWGRPDHPLNREELYLSLIKTQYIPSGDPSSDIVIDGTAKAPFVDVKMYGDTYQQSYTGKNLLKMAGNWTITQGSGVTVTDGNDGSIILDGTVATRQDIQIYGSSNRLIVESGTQLTLSRNTRDYNLIWHKFTSEGSGVTSDVVYISVNGAYTHTYTTASTDYGFQFVLRLPIGTVFQNERIYLQLEKGSTPTTFEPYVGGQASPSPDYPQPIQTVTGRQVVEVQGKNLLKLNDGATTLSGVSITTTNGTVNLKGTATSGEQGYYVPVNITASEPMVFSTNKSGTMSGLVIKLQYKRGETVYYPTVGSSLSLQAGDIIQQMYLIISNGSVLDGSFSPMLEKGSTATSYEPYSKQTYEIDLNCNIYDKSQSYKDAYDIRIPIAINPGSKYVFSAPTSWVGAYLYDSSGNFTRTIGHTQNTRSGEFTAGSNEVKAIFTFYAGSGVTWSWSDIKFYDLAGVIELCKLGTYQDYIWKDGDSWKVHKAIAKATLDGSEDWTKNDNANPFYVANIYKKIGACKQSTSPASALFSHFTTVGIYGGDTNLGACVLVDVPNRIANVRARISDMSGSTSSFKTMLSEKRPVLYARKDTPTDTIITDTALIAQLEALVKGGSEEGTTYIKLSAPEPNLPGLLYVEAAKYE